MNIKFSHTFDRPGAPPETSRQFWQFWQPSMTMGCGAYCPDLLRYEQIGEADTLRGRVVRTFFWLLRRWPP